MVRDTDAAQFEATEARLYAWGTACSQTAMELGVPSISNIASTIARIQHAADVERESRRRQSMERKRILRAERKRLEKLEQHLTPEQMAELKGYLETPVTAQGKQTQSTQIPKAGLDSRILEVDRIVRDLPKWAQKCIFRAYMYRQADRVAALELKMRVGEYAQRRRKAVEIVAEKLDRRYIRRACR